MIIGGALEKIVSQIFCQAEGMSNVLSDPASNENGASTLYREELGQVEAAFCWRQLVPLIVSSMALRKDSILVFPGCIDWRLFPRLRSSRN